jgi:hypothetical protein
MGDDSAERLAGDLANAAIACLECLLVNSFDLNKRFDQAALPHADGVSGPAVQEEFFSRFHFASLFCCCEG